jgi:Cytochrome C and Quinol oxidase polypeptide I
VNQLVVPAGVPIHFSLTSASVMNAFYILILPAFGVFSEVVATFSGKPLFGYRSMVAATMAICILSFTVWLHHFFTMGAGADVCWSISHWSLENSRVPAGCRIPRSPS